MSKWPGGIPAFFPDFFLQTFGAGLAPLSQAAEARWAAEGRADPGRSEGEMVRVP